MNLFDVYPLFPVRPVKAQGSWLWDDRGFKYLDLYGGHAVISIGHSHPWYVEKLTKQLEKIAFYSNSVKITQQEELAHKLGELSGYPDYSLFLCNSGAEANENSLKLASFHTGRKKIIAFRHSFHGRTSLAVACTDDLKIQAPVNKSAEVVFLPLNDEKALEEQMSSDVAAVIVEGIQGVAGVYPAGSSFLQKIKTLCEKHGSLLILDEVQSGYGRTGDFFAHQQSGVRPDMITVAKGMGNGFPIGGVLISPHIQAKHGMLGTTFGGNYLACTAGIAVLDVIKKEGLLKNALLMGEYLKTHILGIPGVKEIRGRGLMTGIEINTSCVPIREGLLSDHRMFTGSSSNKNTLRILPALNIGKDHLETFVIAFKKSLQTLPAVS
jgi:acetylornithine/N-succinyldiaminopimelate aminotransferase